MEENLHSINAMKTMEIIDVNTGSKLGFIKDIKIDREDNRVLAILLPGEVKGWFSKSDDMEIPWERIVKVGVDVILVSAERSDGNNIYP